MPYRDTVQFWFIFFLIKLVIFDASRPPILTSPPSALKTMSPTQHLPNDDSGHVNATTCNHMDADASIDMLRMCAGGHLPVEHDVPASSPLTRQRHTGPNVQT